MRRSRSATMTTRRGRRPRTSTQCDILSMTSESANTCTKRINLCDGPSGLEDRGPRTADHFMTRLHDYRCCNNNRRAIYVSDLSCRRSMKGRTWQATITKTSSSESSCWLVTTSHLDSCGKQPAEAKPSLFDLRPQTSRPAACRLCTRRRLTAPVASREFTGERVSEHKLREWD